MKCTILFQFFNKPELSFTAFFTVIKYEYFYRVHQVLVVTVRDSTYILHTAG
jgi:hypothetical protein